jgi:hypothetical protein
MEVRLGIVTRFYMSEVIAFEICRGKYVNCNKEPYQLYRSPDIITSIRISRLRWAGHVERMSDENILERIMDCAQGKRGRMRLKNWEDRRETL